VLRLLRDFADIDDVFWLAFTDTFPEGTPIGRNGLDAPPRIVTIRFGSPLHVLVELPRVAWGAGVASFIGALAAVFGAPYKTLARFHSARAEYWRSRLAADTARREWLDSRKSAHGEEGFRLVDVRLPREGSEADID
jgi:hypothetical protein